MSRLSLLVDLASLLSKHCDLDALLGEAGERVAQALQSERATVWLVDADRGDLFTEVALLPEVPELRLPMQSGIAGYVARTGDTVRVDEAASDQRFDSSADEHTGFVTKNMLAAPIRLAEGEPVHGVLQVLNRRRGTYDEADEKYLSALGTQLARVLALTTLRTHSWAVAGVTRRGQFNHVVGTSDPMAAVYERVRRAAQTDATVLFRGETGTGKGLLARALHDNSARRSKPFVVVDCTTLPRELVESELFGHERGAFTGADRSVVGKVELASGGTLFLDEIGELPLDIQAKFLRFVQDRSFERVGGKRTLTADVRLLCATHRDLARAVDEGSFRRDLYYRIRVVEVEVPALRERGGDDISILAQHFLDHYAQRHGRALPSLDETSVRALGHHSWPGNVRELEHWAESAVVLGEAGTLRPELLPVSVRSDRAARQPSDVFCIRRGATLAEVDRLYVEDTLNLCDGNRTRASRLLGVGRNTVGRILKKGG